MKSLAFHREQGPSIRFLNLIMLAAALIISGILSWAMTRTTQLYNESHEVTQNLIQLEENSSDLMEASDYLTEQIRAFVVTGEKRFLDNYFEEANVTKRREKALDTLKNSNEESVSYQNLLNAMYNSKELMYTEYYAARLAVEGYGYDINDYPEEIQNVKLKEPDSALSPEEKLDAAEDMLFDEAYFLKKDSIRENTDNCISLLEKEMAGRQLDAAKRLKRQVFVEHTLTVIQIVITILIVLLTALLVIIPLHEAVEKIRNERDINLKGAYEIRFLAKTYNLMYRTNLENKEKLSYAATHDKLTGLYNRRGYDYLIRNLDMETSTLLIIDLDDFKKVNDTYGHDTGDKVLTKAADTIYNSFRDQDYVCRIGGDEFAVIMVHSNSALKELIARKVELMNEKMKEESGQVPAASLSVGVAFGESGKLVDEIFKDADTALYEAKKNGKGRVFFSKV